MNASAGKLANQVAWITGAGSGIGLSSALALADGGATVALSGRRREALDAAVSRIESNGGRAYAMPVDVADRDGVANAAAEIRARSGAIDILVNSAGINVREREWRNVSAEAWRHIVDVNLNGAFNTISAVLPDMRARRCGTIVNIASWAAVFDVSVSGPAYSASKRAMVAMNHSINLEECVNGIRACVICPAEVATEIMSRRPAPPSEADLARMLQPEDLGRTVRFVCEMPPHACINEIIVSPTWNRLYIGRSVHD